MIIYHCQITMASSVQRVIYSVLSSIGCTRVNIDRKDENNSFNLSYAHNWKLLIYVFCHINFLIKVTFVILLSFGVFEPVTEFFDWIAILLWFLIIFMILTSERLFFRKHPFFEILTAGWSYEETLYQSLIDTGENFKKHLHGVAKSRVFLQSWIAGLGSAAMLFQYLAAPKYCVFTYSAIEEDTLPLYILFGAHELLFIFHGWQFYGGIIYVSSCFGGELTLCISTLTGALQFLSPFRRITDMNRLVKLPYDNTSASKHSNRGMDGINRRVIVNSHTNSLEHVMFEYRKLTVWSDTINDYGSYNFLIIHGLAYCQMVSDVFVMIQLLRMPDTDIIGVIFFAEDAGVCMYMLFKVFKSMSFVAAASDDFLSELKMNITETKLPSGNRLYLRKLSKSIRKIQMKIGPSMIGPGMVGNAMMTLLNYYITVMLW